MEPIKMALFGDSCVGKTKIIHQYIENTFDDEHIYNNNNCDRVIKEIELKNGIKIKIEILDTVGQLRFRAVNKIFMKLTKIALLIYDITYQESLKSLNEFYSDIKEVNREDNVFFVVVGNKTDLYEKQVISTEMGKEFAHKINALFFEVSAMDNESINNLFYQTVTEYVKTRINFNDDNKNNRNSNRNSFSLKNQKDKKKEKNCC